MRAGNARHGETSKARLEAKILACSTIDERLRRAESFYW